MFEKFLAAFGLLACLLLLLRMALSARARHRLDRALEQPLAGLRLRGARWSAALAARLGRRNARALPPRTWRSDRDLAKRSAEDVIDRARRGAAAPPRMPPRAGTPQDSAAGRWDGNVFRPDRFRRPRKPH